MRILLIILFFLICHSYLSRNYAQNISKISKYNNFLLTDNNTQLNISGYFDDISDYSFNTETINNENNFLYPIAEENISLLNTAYKLYNKHLILLLTDLPPPFKF